MRFPEPADRLTLIATASVPALANAWAGMEFGWCRSRSWAVPVRPLVGCHAPLGAVAWELQQSESLRGKPMRLAGPGRLSPGGVRLQSEPRPRKSAGEA